MNKGILYVDYPDSIKAISQNSIRAAKKLETIINDTQIEPYDRKTNSGFWRILLYRESKKTKQVLISVVVTQDH